MFFVWVLPLLLALVYAQTPTASFSASPCCSNPILPPSGGLFENIYVEIGQMVPASYEPFEVLAMIDYTNYGDLPVSKVVAVGKNGASTVCAPCTQIVMDFFLEPYLSYTPTSDDTITGYVTDENVIEVYLDSGESNRTFDCVTALRWCFSAELPYALSTSHPISPTSSSFITPPSPPTFSTVSSSAFTPPSPPSFSTTFSTPTTSSTSSPSPPSPPSSIVSSTSISVITASSNLPVSQTRSSNSSSLISSASFQTSLGVNSTASTSESGSNGGSGSNGVSGSNGGSGSNGRSGSNGGSGSGSASGSSQGISQNSSPGEIAAKTGSAESKKAIASVLAALFGLHLLFIFGYNY